MRDYVWTIRVTSMPEGSVLEDGSFNPAWEPEGWGEEMASLKRAGIMRPEETEFFWPVMDQVWMSRSTATKRVKLLERYGATAEVVRSPLRWETPGSVSGRLRSSVDEFREAFDSTVDVYQRFGDKVCEEHISGAGVVERLDLLAARTDATYELLSQVVGDLSGGHDSSPSVGGCGDPQPTEGEARKGGDAA